MNNENECYQNINVNILTASYALNLLKVIWEHRKDMLFAEIFER